MKAAGPGGSSKLSCALTGRPASGIRGSEFSPRGEDLHIPTLRNHIILIGIQMKGKLWKWLWMSRLSKMFYQGGGVRKGREPGSLLCRSGVFCRGTRVGWHMAKSEGNTSSLSIAYYLLVLISWYLNNSCRF